MVSQINLSFFNIIYFDFFDGLRRCEVHSILLELHLSQLRSWDVPLFLFFSLLEKHDNFASQNQN